MGIQVRHNFKANKKNARWYSDDNDADDIGFPGKLMWFVVSPKPAVGKVGKMKITTHRTVGRKEFRGEDTAAELSGYRLN